jgi:hypothetical protein
MFIAATVGTGVSASGETGPLGPDEHCGTGNVEAITRAFYPLFFNSDGPADDVATRCQFRLFAEPSEGICFDELDHFVGGFVISFDKSERELLEQVEIDISPPELGGLEPEPTETPIKALGSEHIIWKQWSVTFSGLSPGSYTVATSLSFRGSLVEEFEVEFHVLPHEAAHELGRPESGLQGSVVCPPEVLS